MPAQRERERPVVGDDVLALGRRGRRRRLRRTWLPARSGGSRSTPATSHTAPWRWPASAASASASARRARSRRSSAARCARSATSRERPRLPRRDDPLRAGFGQAGDRSAAQAQSGTRKVGRRRRGRTPSPIQSVPERQISGRPTPFSSVQSHSLDRHVDRPHLDAVPARVLHELRRRVEAHRLRVEQRAAEGRRLVALEPADT